MAPATLKIDYARIETRVSVEVLEADLSSGTRWREPADEPGDKISPPIVRRIRLKDEDV